LTHYPSLPYSAKVIAEVISLSEYESQVSKLLTEDERSAMEYFLAAAPEGHPVIAGVGKHDGRSPVKARAAAPA